MNARLASFLVLGGWVVLLCHEAIFEGKTWLFHDLYHHHLPWRTWAASVLADGELPVWAPIGHGYPLLADGQAGILYHPDRIPYALLSALQAHTVSIVAHHLAATWGAAALAGALGRSESGVIVAGATYGLSGFFVSHLVYLPMFQVIAWFPWLVLFAILAVRQGGRWWWALGLSSGLVQLAGHPQVAFYVIFGTIVAVLGLVRTGVVEGSMRSAWIAVGVACVVALPQWVATAELLPFGGRAGPLGATAFMGALPPEELLNLVFPHWLGVDSPADVPTLYHHRAGAYAGRGVSYWEDCCTVGAIALLLVLNAGWTKQGRAWWVLLLLGLFAMLGGLQLLPPFSWFRFPARAGVWVTLAAAQLAALGLDRLGGHLNSFPDRVARKAMVGAGGLVLAFAGASVLHVAAPTWGPWLVELLSAHTGRAADLVAELRRDVDPTAERLSWPAFLVAIGLLGPIGVAWRGWRPILVSRGLALLVALELFAYGYGYNPAIDADAQRPPGALPMLGVPGPFRTTTAPRRVDAALAPWLIPANLGLAWGLEDVIVPSPLRMERNEAYLRAAGLDLALDDPQLQQSRLAENRSLLDLSGVRYLQTTWDLALEDLHERARWGEVRLYENTRALPRAFVVGCTVPAGSDALSRLLEVDVHRIAVVDAPALEPCRLHDPIPVALTRPTHKDWEMRVTLAEQGFLVLTETRYPGQRWVVDGAPVEAWPTDSLFSGVPLPPGEHFVTMRYRPLMLSLSAVASHLMVLLALLQITRARRTASGLGAP